MCGGPAYQVSGWVSPGYEICRSQFEESLNLGYDKNTQLCVYVGEECVIDLIATKAGTLKNSCDQAKSKVAEMSADTTTCIWSSGKVLGSIMMGIAKSNGWLSFEEKVTTYWPEFGNSACGKENLTVADVMRHEANLEKLDISIPIESTLTENIKKNMIGKVIEDTKSFNRPECNRVYHSHREWISNEIFRRVEPSGRTMGEYFE